MHASILGAGLRAPPAALALAWAVTLGVGTPQPAKALPPARAGAPLPCPVPGAAVVERFFSADCADCWAQAPGGMTPAMPAGKRQAGPWTFDWITPGQAEAPLAAGALPESDERLDRAGAIAGAAAAATDTTAAAQPAAKLPNDRAQLRLQAQQASPNGVRLLAKSGPAWRGYFGTEFRLQQRGRTGLPAGSTGWLALLELVDAGTDGTPVSRALVRSVAGPLPLDSLSRGQTVSHLRALRWPASAEPGRLQTRAWVESPDGRVLMVAADRCPGAAP